MKKRAYFGKFKTPPRLIKGGRQVIIPNPDSEEKPKIVGCVGHRLNWKEFFSAIAENSGMNRFQFSREKKVRVVVNSENVTE